MREERTKFSLFFRTIACVVLLTFFFTFVLSTSIVSAQTTSNLPSLPTPGEMVTLSPPFTPPLIKGITIKPDNPLRFDFIVYRGDSEITDKKLEEEGTRLIKYFLASLTIPKRDLWVNLSPYEGERIIAETFGTTEMGRDLLAQDYVLKQITASLTYPEEGLGKKFWDRVYHQAYTLYGTTEIPFNTFNKIWITPDAATVFEQDHTAFIVNSHLKVMLEQDYLAMNKAKEARIEKSGALGYVDPGDLSAPVHQRPSHEISSQIAREVLIPAIEKEVNEGKNFALLRQIYHSLILAMWYKQRLKESLLGQVYADKNRVKGVDLEDKTIKEKIYKKYLEAFQTGAYNYIREDYGTATQQIILRKYFSGGFEVEERFNVKVKTDHLTLLSSEQDNLADVEERLINEEYSTLTSAFAEFSELPRFKTLTKAEGKKGRRENDLPRQIIYQEYQLKNQNEKTEIYPYVAPIQITLANQVNLTICSAHDMLDADPSKNKVKGQQGLFITDGKGHYTPLKNDIPVVLGRSKANQHGFNITAPIISSTHIEIKKHGNKIILRDLESSNGTSVKAPVSRSLQAPQRKKIISDEISLLTNKHKIFDLTSDQPLDIQLNGQHFRFEIKGNRLSYKRSGGSPRLATEGTNPYRLASQNINITLHWSKTTHRLIIVNRTNTPLKILLDSFDQLKRTQETQQAMKKVIPYHNDMLRNEIKANANIVTLLKAINCPQTIEGMINYLKGGQSESNKLKVIEAFSFLADSGHLSVALAHDSNLKTILYLLVKPYLRDGLESPTEYLAVENVLKAAVKENDIKKLVDIYNKNGAEVQKAVLGILQGVAFDKSSDFFIKAFSSQDEEFVTSTLKVFSQIILVDDFKSFIQENEAIQEKLVTSLEEKIFAHPVEAISILSSIGPKARNTLLSRHPHIGEVLENKFRAAFLSLLSIDPEAEEKREQLISHLRAWLFFISQPGKIKKADRKEDLLEEYFLQREEITDLILELKDYLAKNTDTLDQYMKDPNKLYQRIITDMHDRLKQLGVKAHVRFKIGIIKYLRNRQRVWQIEKAAIEAGIRDGDRLRFFDIQYDDGKRKFLTDLLGFVPEDIQIFFSPEKDNIHIRLKDLGYAHQRYLTDNNITHSQEDMFDQLEMREKKGYVDSLGLYDEDYSRVFRGIRTARLLTFGRGIEKGLEGVRPHEEFHKFFREYAIDEITAWVPTDTERAQQLIEKINTANKDEQVILRIRLIDEMVTGLLALYQDEIMADIIEGNWIKKDDLDFLEWFVSYTGDYQKPVAELLDMIEDKEIREEILDTIFSEIQGILERHKPKIDTVINLKTEFFKTKQHLSHQEAFKKVNTWVALFLQTIPAHKFDRLEEYSARLEKGLNNLKQKNPLSRKVASKSDKAMLILQEKDVGGIDLNPDHLNLQIKRDDNGIPLPVHLQNVENIDIEGLTPVIINIVPTTFEHLPFLGSMAEVEEMAI